MSFKFIAYADIHYDRLAAQCVTFDDCAGVEQQVHQRVFEGDFDFTVFIGDRFLKTSPFALPGMPQEFVQGKLVEFLSGISPILLAFVTAANSSALNHIGDA